MVIAIRSRRKDERLNGKWLIFKNKKGDINLKTARI